jgi:ferredoxin-NADP reductase/predicted pyridoxine 5'-phosphate oxidase superfamily flavin-nucleotide-binding protein
MDSPPPLSTAPWHEGELRIQRQLGVATRMDDIGRRFIRDYLPDQHIEFYRGLPFAVLGAVDGNDDAWATVRAGNPGFLHAPDPRRLAFEIRREESDPAEGGLINGGALGLLGINLGNRRRNRVNGVIRRDADTRFEMAVEHSYGNCPRYIQLRNLTFARLPEIQSEHPPVHLSELDSRARAMIQTADSFFVASYVDRADGHRQVDASHRGGKPGFVRIEQGDALTIPDFAGNLFFNTLGNFVLNPRAGLLFVDFRRGDVLQMTGTVEVIFDSPEIAAFQGAERLWRFEPSNVIYRQGALPIRWDPMEQGISPASTLTGSWEETAQRLKADALANTWRPFRVSRIVQESTVIRSFHLEPTDDAGLAPHLAGQHLPVRLALPSTDAPTIRTYTLSVAPSDKAYRISVKRDGVFSIHLHDAVHEGAVIEARGPAGQFTIETAVGRPAVLLAGGIGITPMLAMLRHIVYEGLREQRVRPTWLFQAARTLPERAFDQEIHQLVDDAMGAVRLVRVLGDTAGAEEEKDYEAAGRIEMALLKSTLPFGDYDFYMCGPPAFMQAIYDGLRGLNIADDRIHAEAFGPASLARSGGAGENVTTLAPASSVPVRVAFIASAKEARWMPEGGTLLELAEARGLSPEFSCRAGTCGTCKIRVVSGAVTYPAPPAFSVPDGEALICCAVPATMDDDATLQLDL